MYISLTSSRTSGFKKWSSDHKSSNDNDNPGGATPIAVMEPAAGGDAAAEAPHRPWGIPGVGGAF